MLPARDSHQIQTKNRMKVKEQKKDFHISSNQKRERMAIPKSDKIDFESRKFIRKRRILYVNKMFNIARSYNNYKYLCI